MNKTQLIRYQAELWPAACAGQKWDPKDDARRRDTRAYCWEAIGLIGHSERTPRDQAEVTALFTLLAWLAEPDNITKSQRWDDCKADYKAFNDSKQADYWQSKAYGKGGGKRITGQRFQGRARAQQPAFADEPLDRQSAAQRLMTMRARATKKQREPQPF